MLPAILRNLRRQTLPLCLLLVLAYWPFTLVLTTWERNEWMQMVRVAIGFAVILEYAPAVWRAVRMDAPTYAQQLAAGLALNALGATGQGLWLILWRVRGQPLTMINSDFNGWLIWIQIVGWGLCVTAPGAIDGDIPKPNLVRLAAALVAGLSAGALMALWR